MASTISFEVKRSHRARALRLRVLAGGSAVLTVPLRASDSVIQKFIAQHDAWIRRAVAKMKDKKKLPVSGRRGYREHKEAARAFILERVAYWNTHYRAPVGRISVRHTRTRWGSCSHKNNLNFSYALLFLPRELADYCVVHELCHIREHNHSSRFWAHVAETFPHYKHLRKELRSFVL